ncbi:MAG: adenosine kinase, partial [Desulfobacter sp.]|nr:adenosine kinase [Desulfobacter sp.]
MPSNTITGIGSALVDVLINETDEFLHKLNKEKGGMTYVTSAEQQDIISASSQIPVIVPGGAACNTILGIGNLGGTA